MPVFSVFYGEVFHVSSVELREYSSVVTYIHAVLAMKVGMATCCRLEGLGVASQWGGDSLYPPRLALGSTQPPIQ